MKKNVIFLLLNMFTVSNVYKCNDTDNISKEESEKAGETIHQPDTILIEFDVLKELKSNLSKFLHSSNMDIIEVTSYVSK